MITVRRVTKFLLACLVLSFSAGSFADSARTSETRQAGADWACWYESGDFSIRCLLVHAPRLEAAKVELIRQSIDRRLPNVVGEIWATPEKMADRVVSIPLWNTPSEWDFARELADAVMCGGRRDCALTFDLNPDGRGPMRAAALQDGVETAEVLAEIANQWRGQLGATLAVADQVSEERPRSRRRRAALAG